MVDTTTELTFKLPLQRVMPTIYVAGPAKSGSTFLWECIQQSFHPDRVCGRHSSKWSDAMCGERHFVLPALVADVSQPSCLRFQKESSFWRYWGRRKQVTWRRYGGPRLPLAMWELDRVGLPCGARRRAVGWRDTASGPRSLAAHRQMEDICMQDVHCPSSTYARDGAKRYETRLPAECMPTCSPCELHPGWMNNFDAPCPYSPEPCDTVACANAPYVPKRVRALNFSAHHARAFTLTAFPSSAALLAANVSVDRVASVEGNPGIFQTPPRHARALASLVTKRGQGKLKFIVGLRDPFDLAFSLWSFLSSIGQEGRRVEARLGRALAAVQACNLTLADDPSLLLHLSAAELTNYRLCLDDRPRARQHFYLYGGLYGLHLLGWFHLGFTGRQFLFVRMTSLPRDAEQAARLQRKLAGFVGMDLPQVQQMRQQRDVEGLCLSASMITRKQSRVRAHNSTVREIKRDFRVSPAAIRLRRFLDGHMRLLQALIERDGVHVY
jgi:hypothetical protein